MDRKPLIVTRKDALHHAVMEIDKAFYRGKRHQEKDSAPELTREIISLIVEAGWPPCCHDEKLVKVNKLLNGELEPTDWGRLSSAVAKIMDSDDLHEWR